MIIRFIIYGALGCFMEVIWTGFAALIRKNFKLMATTSLWMFFIYGMVVLLEPVCRLLVSLPMAARGAVYACCIFAGEYMTGSLLKRADICPWDYSGTRYSVKGLIRLDYAPVWFAVGLIFEQVYFFLTRFSF